MAEANDLIAISLGPQELAHASDTGWNIELKLDWADLEPGGALHSRDGFSELLSDSEVEADQIVDIHLPPGTSSSNPGMSATEDNIGAITDFCYDHLEDMPDKFLTTHPPKDFRYLDQLWVLNDLLDRVPNDVSIENTSDPSKWYTPEAIAFFGFVGSQYPASFEDLYLTVDSAHLPQEDYVGQDFDKYYDPDSEEVQRLMEQADVDKDWLFEINYDRVEDIVHEINEDLSGEDDVFPVEYIGYMGSNFQEMVQEYRSGRDGIITDNDLTGDVYLPFLRVLAMTGDRVRSVHLNDPVTNDVPDMDDYRESEALQTAVEYMKDHDTYMVLEPEGETSRQDAEDYVDTVSEMLEGSA